MTVVLEMHTKLDIYVFFISYHWVDTSAGGLLPPKVLHWVDTSAGGLLPPKVVHWVDTSAGGILPPKVLHWVDTSAGGILPPKVLPPSSLFFGSNFAYSIYLLFKFTVPK